MSSLSQLDENYARVEEAITAACGRAGRSRSEITLVAVSKTHSASVVEEALRLGLKDLGENRVQEWQSKRLAIEESLLSHARVHLIGHLQSNKSTRAVEIFHSVDSVDSIRLAERLNNAAASVARVLPVLIEIKLSDEQSKEGLTPESAELSGLLERLPEYQSLHFRGLMTVPPYLRDAEAVRPYFTRLRELRDRLMQSYPRLNLATLSMGMSHDFAVAVEEGSTEIRIGTALFGARQLPQESALT